ncbi:MAG TPA: response regulator, partial [Saprospiraceae bacterium]|nr:response regulator [Saprospiraceae bacterium]
MENRNTIDILIIDDTAADARLFQLMLEDQSPLIGDITLLTGSQAAFRTFTDQFPEIIFMNIGAFSEDQIESLEKLVHQSQSYVIATSDIDDHSLAEKAIRAGAQDFLVKGQFTSEELIKMVELAHIKYRRDKKIRWAQKTGKLAAWSYQPSTQLVDLSDASIFLSEAQLDFLRVEVVQAVEDALAGKSWKKEIPYTLAGDDDVVKEKKYFLLHLEPFSQESHPDIIQGTIQDISERKKTLELQEETHQKYMDIFANSSD